MKKFQSRREVLAGTIACLAAILLSVSAAPHFSQAAKHASTNQIALRVDAAHSHVDFTVSTTLHVVHGTFTLLRGYLTIDPATGRASGEVIVDASSGQSGNASRDKKMHRDVLESWKYSDIIFRPVTVQGDLPLHGAANVTLHGTMSLHGATHEITVPVQANLMDSIWNATGKMRVPYVQWGLKNPGNFLLKVEPVVEVNFDLNGTFEQSPEPH
jgi:polyisoprenoid-binding protein YceI